MPLPFPFPIGITMFLVGCAILTTHSKTFRRGVQYIRHHNGWLSRGLETIARRGHEIAENLVQRIRHREGRMWRAFRAMLKRLPEIVATMVHRTRPSAHGRRARMRARNTGDAT
jgi:hypothetical protein